MIEPSAVKKLKSGGLYALEVDQHLGQSALEQITKDLAPLKEKYGVEFLIFDKGIQVSEVRPTGIAEIESAVERAMARVTKEVIERAVAQLKLERK